MSNKTKQNAGYLTLILVLTVALITGLLVVGKKLQDAQVKSIEQTIQQQFTIQRMQHHTTELCIHTTMKNKHSSTQFNTTSQYSYIRIIS